MDGVRVSVEELSPTVLIVRGHPGEGLEYDWARVAIVDGTNVKIKALAGTLPAKYIAAAFGEVTRLGLRTIQYERLVNGALVTRSITL